MLVKSTLNFCSATLPQMFQCHSQQKFKLKNLFLLLNPSEGLLRPPLFYLLRVISNNYLKIAAVYYIHSGDIYKVGEGNTFKGIIIWPVIRMWVVYQQHFCVCISANKLYMYMYILYTTVDFSKNLSMARTKISVWVIHLNC